MIKNKNIAIDAKISLEKIDGVKNVVLKAPGLAIGSGGKETGKTSNTFQVKCNGIISAPYTTADLPSLATATGRLNIASKVLATKKCRYYTVIGTVNETTSALTLSLIFGDDFSLITDIGRTSYINTDLSLNKTVTTQNKCIVGYLCVLNGAAGDFNPGTTALDATWVETFYMDQFGFLVV